MSSDFLVVYLGLASWTRLQDLGILSSQVQEGDYQILIWFKPSFVELTKNFGQICGYKGTTKQNIQELLSLRKYTHIDKVLNECFYYLGKQDWDELSFQTLSNTKWRTDKGMLEVLSSSVLLHLLNQANSWQNSFIYFTRKKMSPNKNITLLQQYVLCTAVVEYCGIFIDNFLSSF